MSKAKVLLKLVGEADSSIASSLKPGQWKKVGGTGYDKSQAYAARNKKGELAYFTTEEGAKAHAAKSE